MHQTVENRRMGDNSPKKALLCQILILSFPLSIGDLALGARGLTDASGVGAARDTPHPEEPPRYLATKKNGKSKVTRKRTKSPKVDDFGPMDVEPVSRSSADTGIGIHREQEGVDRPYTVEASGSSVVSSLKKEDNQDANSSEILVDTILEATMISGSLQFGLEIQYKSLEESISANPNSAPPSKENRLTEVKIGGGPVLKINFRSLDTSLNVPFVYSGMSYVLDEFTESQAPNTSYKGTTLRFGGGIHLFLDSNISFAPKIEYFAETLKGDKERIITRKGPRALLQFATFL